MLEQQLADAQEAAARARPMRLDDAELQKGREDIENALAMNQKLEEELSKRDELIEVCSLFKMNGWILGYCCSCPKKYHVLTLLPLVE